MRAYTSLLGHIFGSNPAICGYYEMHIGYHSWRSLVRQKLLYFEEEDSKPGMRYMFDKILHSDHDVSLQLLDSKRVRALFSLRRPEKTIPSILNLYRSVDPGHDFNRAEFATAYYIERLNELERLACAMGRDYYYFDAEAVQGDTAATLAAMSDWLDLETPLSPRYSMQKKTSRERYGDTSDRLKSGAVTRHDSGADNIDVAPELLESALPVYSRVRAALIERSARHSLHSAQVQHLRGDTGNR
ncbi:MAG: hypothetical protein R3228_01380 [Halioglobus sp.]|nr:hypothetical protein [Halioglobus sp.]